MLNNCKLQVGPKSRRTAVHNLLLAFWTMKCCTAQSDDNAVGHSYLYSEPRLTVLLSALLAGIRVTELMQPGRETAHVNGNRLTALENRTASLDSRLQGGFAVPV